MDDGILEEIRNGENKCFSVSESLLVGLGVQRDNPPSSQCVLSVMASNFQLQNRYKLLYFLRILLLFFYNICSYDK